VSVVAANGKSWLPRRVERPGVAKAEEVGVSVAGVAIDNSGCSGSSSDGSDGDNGNGSSDRSAGVKSAWERECEARARSKPGDQAGACMTGEERNKRVMSE
jgi:hypothetical protein